MRQLLKYVTLFVFALPIHLVNAQQYKSVAELIMVDEIDMDDPFNQSIVLQRCAGIFGALAKFWPIEDQDQKEKLFMNSMQLLTFATMTMAKKRGLPMDDKAVEDQVSKAFSIYVDTYHDSMERHQIATGSMISELVEGDLTLCSTLTK